MVDLKAMPPELARAYQKAFDAADTPAKRQKIIDTLNLSHAVIGLWLYGKALDNAR